MRSKIVFAFTILLTFLIQCTFLPMLSIGSIRPNLILILCVSIGLMRGRRSGLWTGFFSGLLVDFFYGSVFGFYALIYMYVGYFSGYACSIYYDNDVRVPMAMTAAADIIYNIAVYGLQFLLRGRLGFGMYLYRIIIPEMIYTVFLTFLAYRLYHFINHRLMRVRRKESESIWVLK